MPPMFDTIKEDLKRFEENECQSPARAFIAGICSQGFQALIVYRFFNWCHRHGIPTQPIRFIVERITEIMTGISIPAVCTIGKGLRIHHFGGVIFHSSARIGDFCTIYHQVTIGDRGGHGGAATLGNHVMVGAGAKIIGEITVGDHCIVGANAVVVKDMPENTVAYNNQTRYKRRKKSKE